MIRLRILVRKKSKKISMFFCSCQRIGNMAMKQGKRFILINEKKRSKVLSHVLIYHFEMYFHLNKYHKIKEKSLLFFNNYYCSLSFSWKKRSKRIIFDRLTVMIIYFIILLEDRFYLQNNYNKIFFFLPVKITSKLNMISFSKI